MDTVIQTLQQLETSVLALSADDRKKIQKVYHASLTKFRHKTHKERGEFNYGKPYTLQDEITLQYLTNQGYSNEYIAHKMGRSVKGIIQQRQKLIVKKNPAISKHLVENFTPDKPCANFLIPQHTN